MTPLSIGSRVEVTGKSTYVGFCHMSDRFVIDQIWKRDGIISYSGEAVNTWYPASSLRLVDDELEIGDWVEVIAKGNQFTGKNGQVSEIGETYIALYNMGVWNRGNLRKLTPGEIQQHLKSIGSDESVWECNRDKTITEMKDRLSAIESRLNSLAPSHTELMGDVEALAERMGAIEKHQQEQHERMDRFMQDYREHKDFDFDMHDRIKVLEGEMPEVCDIPEMHKPDYDLIPDRKPNDTPVRIAMFDHNGKAFTTVEETRADAIAWCQKVLDSM
jgi:hypothetical protein